MTDEERRKLFHSIYNDQELLAEDMGLKLKNEIDFNQFQSLGIEIPTIKTSDVSLDELNNISDISQFDKSVFAKWKVSDIPVMFLAGGLGTFSSAALKDFFNDIHTKNGRKPTLKGGHGGEVIDRMPDAKQSGGWGHRTKYGHDLFNPFEIEDWSDYLDKAKQSGTHLPPWLKAYTFWIRHLLQDTFSSEGLPMPGHTLIRKVCDPSNSQTRETLQTFNTLKVRDLAGAGITNAIMGGYLWGTEKSLKRVVAEPNYRCFSLMLGANLITLLSGLLLPTKMSSFNWSTIPLIAYYGGRLLALEKKVREKLKKRDLQLDLNKNVLQKNEEILNQISIMDDKTYKELLNYQDELFAYNEQVLKYHEEVKKQILKEA